MTIVKDVNDNYIAVNLFNAGLIKFDPNSSNVSIYFGSEVVVISKAMLKYITEIELNGEAIIPFNEKEYNLIANGDLSCFSK